MITITRPGVGVGVVVIHNNKTLLWKRKGNHWWGEWSFPGGHLEYGETWDQCVRREALEEVGITLKNIRFGTVTNDVHTDSQKHYVTVVMVADYDSGEIQNLEPNKCEGWEWFSWGSLDFPSPLFLPVQNILDSGFTPFDRTMQLGTYKHYTWWEYEVIWLAHHTETREDMVVYKPLYPVTDLGVAFAKNPLFVRPKQMFCEQVKYDGQIVDRFCFLG